MADLEDVARLALSLEGVTEGTRYGGRAWAVGKAVFAWERPFTGADLERFGDAPVPPLPVVGLSVADLHDKEAVLAEGRAGVFSIEHLEGYAAVLVSLPEVDTAVLEELVTDAWRTCSR